MKQKRANPTVSYLAPDTQVGMLLQANHTLGTANTVTTITLPDWARGFRLTSAAAVEFAVNENPATPASTSGTTLVAASMAVGGTAAADTPETRILPEPDEDYPTRTLKIKSQTGAAVVLVELF